MIRLDDTPIREPEWFQLTKDQKCNSKWKPVYFFSHNRSRSSTSCRWTERGTRSSHQSGWRVADHVRGRDPLQQVKSFSHSGWSDGEYIYLKTDVHLAVTIHILWGPILYQILLWWRLNVLKAILVKFGKYTSDTLIMKDYNICRKLCL